ncbi:MAG TPA: energy transducer TonB [Providencia sp.]|uniref:energy transducer TonB n=1 Tax=Providencia sp. TaxID=589 RepID=UPI000E8D2FB1|nr:energy transducer TonB [Providencia sp.]MBP6082497.1 energy transducer TonB [Providencia sp.]HBO21865.1 energy transducer TonB [Providencia sp.]
MINRRFNYTFTASLLLHGGFIYYCLMSYSTLSSQIYTPINATVISIALTHAVIEKQVSTVAIPESNGGGLISVTAQVENAAIKVNKQKSETHNENKVSKVTKKNISKKNMDEPIKDRVIQKEDKPKSERSDDEKQSSKDGENSAQSQAVGTQGSQNSVALGDDIDSLHQLYLDKLRQEIERHKIYPRKARNMHIEGKVKANFELTAQGELTRILVAKSSNNSQLDNAALEAMRKSRSVGVPPADLNRLITLEIEFTL